MISLSNAYYSPEKYLIMKKPNYIFIRIQQLSFYAFLFCTAITIDAQSQLEKWTLNGQGIDFASGLPVVNSTSASIEGIEASANGFYGPEGNSIFHVIGDKIFSNDGVEVDVFTPPVIGQRIGSEIGIIPVPQEACKYFLIYTYLDTDNPPGLSASLWYSEFDLSLNDNQGGITFGKRDLPIMAWSNASSDENFLPAFAISKPNVENNHFLFTVSKESDGTSRVRKYIFDTDGIVGSSVVVYENQNGDYESFEADLSPDGSMLAFGNFNNNVLTIVHLDSDGNIDPTMGAGLEDGITSISLDNPVIGTEFTINSDYLYTCVDARGIFKHDLSNGASFTMVEDSEDFSNTQIELGPDENIYFVKNPSTIGSIDPVTGSFNQDALPDLDESLIRFSDGSKGAWTLPDQIDGYDYHNVFNNGIPSECCEAVTNYEISIEIVGEIIEENAT